MASKLGKVLKKVVKGAEQVFQAPKALVKPIYEKARTSVPKTRKRIAKAAGRKEAQERAAAAGFQPPPISSEERERLARLAREKGNIFTGI